MQVKATKARALAVVRSRVGSCLYTLKANGDVQAIAVPTPTDFITITVLDPMTEEELLDPGHDGVQGPRFDPHKPLEDQGWETLPRAPGDPSALRVDAL